MQDLVEKDLIFSLYIVILSLRPYKLENVEGIKKYQQVHFNWTELDYLIQ